MNNAHIVTKPAPLPKPVQTGIDTITFWIEIIGGGIAVIALMVLFIGLFFANRGGKGQEFVQNAGWWVAGAIGFGLAGAIAPTFLGL